MPASPDGRRPTAFRWQAFFERVGEPVFLLDGQRRILFVNPAWEALTGLPAGQAHGLRCGYRPPADPTTPEAIAHALCPPPEVMAGAPGRTRRRAPGADGRWWHLEFFPLAEAERVIGVVGKIRAVDAPRDGAVAPLPERLADLRERVAARYSWDSLETRAPAMRRVVNQARLAARVRTPVLIVGEPGAGKEWLARVIHHQGLTREGTFTALDCACLPAAALTRLLEDQRLSPLHREGTLYLKDPASLPRELQRQISDLVQERGAEAGARLVASLAKAPPEEVRAGRLLPDLALALEVFAIAVPPLRERREDLSFLVERLWSRAVGPQSGGTVALTPEAWELVRAYHWPGNLAEVLRVLRCACRRARPGPVDVGHVPRHIRLAAVGDGPARTPERPVPLDEFLEQAERRLIGLALRRSHGNKTRAAELLGIWRARLLRRMEALNIPDPGGGAEET